MAKLTCSRCGAKNPDKYKFCDCGFRLQPGLVNTPPNKVGVPLFLGVVFLPLVFAWFTLRKGYSKKARVLSFQWLIITLLPVVLPLMFGGSDQKTVASAPTPIESEKKVQVAPKTKSVIQKAKSPAPKPKKPKYFKSNGTMFSLQYYLAHKSDITYKHLKKNADRHRGKVMWVRGKIMTILESGGVTQIQLETKHKGYGIWSDQIMVFYKGLTPFVEDNIVRVAGRVVGDYSYTSRAGWKMSVPALRADFVVSGKSVFIQHYRDFDRLMKEKGKSGFWDCHIEETDNGFDPQKLTWDAGTSVKHQLFAQCMKSVTEKDRDNVCRLIKNQYRICMRLFRRFISSPSGYCKALVKGMEEGCCEVIILTQDGSYASRYKIVTGKECKSKVQRKRPKKVNNKISSEKEIMRLVEDATSNP